MPDDHADGEERGKDEQEPAQPHDTLQYSAAVSWASAAIR
jgi:hypothetical protein